MFKTVFTHLSRLNACIIIYGKLSKFPKNELNVLRKIGLKVYFRPLNKKEMQNLVCNSKFGFFPNITDCSPRIITECLVQNTPVLVNNKILGGWKYINNETGRLFTIKTFKKDLRFMLENKFSPRKNFIENYGFRKSAVKLAKILSKHYKIFNDYEMVYFADHKVIMKRILNS